MTSVKTYTSPVNTAKSVLQHVKYEHLVAGITGGVASTLILHPLDLIKIRFAVCDGRSPTPQYNGLRNAITTIFRQEGFRGLYKGVTPNVWGSGSAWGFYFLFYNSIKTWVQGGNSKTPLGPSMHMLLAAQAGVLTLIMTNPVWVVKTRLCLQYSNAKPQAGSGYAGMVDALMTIYRLEGVRGLYRGFLPGMFGVSHGAIQFMAYEEMKTFYNQYKNCPIDAKLGTLEYLGFAATSKLLAASVTYPYQVVRARLQDQYHCYSGSLDCIRQTWRYEGFLGFYKGLSPNLCRVVPATMITFVTYENVWRFVNSLKIKVNETERETDV